MTPMPRSRGRFRNVRAVQHDASRVRVFETGDNAQDRRFAAAGRAEQHKRFALCDIEIYIF